MSGHTSFVYSLATLATASELVSSGEDRSVRVWQGDALIQTLTIPAISIWSVGTLQDGGSSDHQVRVFTRQKERIADQEELDVSHCPNLVLI
jgi:phospholipase A-2-activating protein